MAVVIALVPGPSLLFRGNRGAGRDIGRLYPLARLDEILTRKAGSYQLTNNG